jgi:hypothetical protein
MGFQTGETPDWLASLSRALLDEASVLKELENAIVSQRMAVASNDDETLRATSQAVGRIAQTLEEAKKRRASLLHYLTGREDLALNQLEYFLGEPLPLELDTARAQVRHAVLAVAREAGVNRTELQKARGAKDAFLQELFAAVSRSGSVWLGENEEGGARLDHEWKGRCGDT